MNGNEDAMFLAISFYSKEIKNSCDLNFYSHFDFLKGRKSVYDFDVLLKKVLKKLKLISVFLYF